CTASAALSTTSSALSATSSAASVTPSARSLPAFFAFSAAFFAFSFMALPVCSISCAMVFSVCSACKGAAASTDMNVNSAAIAFMLFSLTMKKDTLPYSRRHKSVMGHANSAQMLVENAGYLLPKWFGLVGQLVTRPLEQMNFGRRELVLDNVQ